MQIYLPIAEMSVTAESIFFLSAFVGFLSGIFGVGGGFMTTPFLIFLGIPPSIAVGTQASQLVASSTTGVLGHFRSGNVDVKMGLVMLFGGISGSFVGIGIFKLLQFWGQIDFAVSVLYIVLLGSIGVLMLVESVSKFFIKSSPVRKEFNKKKVSPFVHKLPYKMRFPRSKLYISALLPGGIGFIGGVLASVLGIGGGFILVPAMIYFLGMPILLVAGTSLFQIIFTAATATILHATLNHTVDIILAFILIAGGVVGAQLGLVFARFVKGNHARVVLAILILVVCFRLCADLFIPPENVYSTVVAL
ncbi:MAG: sulfite exporter TauE/SafE family protein [Micavibrio sp.]|nr:sulfite exporter TauE/SafE family protein [Micavibrio sp.]